MRDAGVMSSCSSAIGVDTESGRAERCKDQSAIHVRYSSNVGCRSRGARHANLSGWSIVSGHSAISHPGVSRMRSFAEAKTAEELGGRNVRLCGKASWSRVCWSLEVGQGQAAAILRDMHSQRHWAIHSLRSLSVRSRIVKVARR